MGRQAGYSFKSAIPCEQVQYKGGPNENSSSRNHQENNSY